MSKGNKQGVTSNGNGCKRETSNRNEQQYEYQVMRNSIGERVTSKDYQVMSSGNEERVTVTIIGNEQRASITATNNGNSNDNRQGATDINHSKEQR